MRQQPGSYETQRVLNRTKNIHFIRIFILFGVQNHFHYNLVINKINQTAFNLHIRHKRYDPIVRVLRGCWAILIAAVNVMRLHFTLNAYTRPGPREPIIVVIINVMMMKMGLVSCAGKYRTRTRSTSRINQQQQPRRYTPGPD